MQELRWLNFHLTHDIKNIVLRVPLNVAGILKKKDEEEEEASLCFRGCSSSALPCRKFKKNPNPPDDDVISYGFDLNIITKNGEPVLRYVRAGTHAERCVCVCVNRPIFYNKEKAGRRKSPCKLTRGYFEALRAASGNRVRVQIKTSHRSNQTASW